MVFGNNINKMKNIIFIINKWNETHFGLVYENEIIFILENFVYFEEV